MTLWRPMEPVDLEEVHSIADRTHPDHPEDFAVLAERRQLFPDGCKVLDRDGAIVGYAISHPWLFGAPPALNSLLGALPAEPNTLYLHDLAIASAARGNGCASRAVQQLAGLATQLGLPNVSLVAVSGSRVFWEKHGFVPKDLPGLSTKLASYGGDAIFLARDLTSPA